jgi:uncharacterized membrane protein
MRSTTTFLNHAFCSVLIACIETCEVFFLLHNAISLSSSDCMPILTLLIPAFLYAKNLLYSIVSGVASKLISCAVLKNFGLMSTIVFMIFSICSGLISDGVPHQIWSVFILLVLMISLYI